MKNLDWLYSLEVFGTKLGLGPITELLIKLDNPEANLKCIHVAGTNGKGSVCSMLASILKEAGYKVGLYTSPHLKRFAERIQINGKEISEKRLDETLGKIKSQYTNQTFFEVTTAAAFQYFKEEAVDFVVLEVGLGGRLDATNIIIPLVSIITHISLEHTHVLGKTVEEIAKEKAGIIKENVPLITLVKKPALKIIKRIAKERNSKLIIPKKQSFELGLKGEFQKENASLAVKAAELLGVDKNIIKQGLKNTKWPGRFEFLEKNILVDCAHNPEGLISLRKEIKKIRKNYEKIIAVVGILKDKDKKTMVETISKFSDYIIFTRPKSDRAEDPQELRKYTTKKREIILDVKKALKMAKKISNPKDLIVVTGSIYTVGEILIYY